jgi:hypothetical protein
VLVSFDNLPR